MLTILLFGSLPWVLGNYGACAAGKGGTTLSKKILYFPLADPPVRWRDLKQASEGNQDAINQLKEAIARFDRAYPSLTSHDADEYSFQVVRPKPYENSRYSNATKENYIEINGNRFRYSLWKFQPTSFGWPIAIVSDQKHTEYAYGDKRFKSDALLTIEHDMEHKSTTAKYIYWLNIYFLVLLTIFFGQLVWRVMISLNARTSAAKRAGVLVSVAIIGVIALGSSHRVVHDNNAVMGDLEPVLSTNQRVWKRSSFNAQVESNAQVQLLAKKLILDFGEMKYQNNLVAIGYVARQGSILRNLDYGIGWFEFFSVEKTTYFQQNNDATQTPVSVPKIYRRLVSMPDYGALYFDWTAGPKPMAMYGLWINYRDIVLVIFGMSILLKVFHRFLLVWFWWVRRRRLRHCVCVWCGYPCGDR